MSLFEHLAELRSRLMKCSIAVLILGAVSLTYAKPIFQFLMLPVLKALPADTPSLIYTSAIEEINVLLKVGLYTGIFLTTPVILWQIWGFVSPGLYPSERRFAAPFVVVGSVAFIGGAAFCYVLVLPEMFKFLLRESDSAALEKRVDTAGLREDEALRLLRIGQIAHAGEVGKAAAEELAADGEGQARAEVTLGQGRVELQARIAGMGRLVDAVITAFGPGERPVLKQVMETRLKAITAFGAGDVDEAGRLLDEAAAQLASVAPSDAAVFAALWQLEKDMAVGRARYQAQNWTRPMLTMKEQLSLVLLLELAFGVIFELPLVMAVLGLVGILKASWLFKYQRYAIVVCLIAAAIITPTGDPVNLMLMAGPMIACYEVGLVAVWLIEKRRKKNAATTDITPA